MYEDHIKHRDQFEVIAIHDKSAKSLQEMDAKLPQIKDLCWQGKDLPFPVLLDDGGKTEEIFGVQAHPTSILIDPDGIVVGEIHSSMLESKLPKVTAVKRLARVRDMYRNRVSSWSPGTVTLEKFRKTLEADSGCKIELDNELLESLDLDKETKMPILISGTAISFRCLEHLALAPLGLQLQPAEDPYKLVLGKVDGEPEFSTDQNRRNERLKKRLGQKPQESKFEDQTLESFIMSYSQKVGVSMAVATKALKEKRVDPAMKLNGVITGESLQTALEKFFEANELKFRTEMGVIIVESR